MTWNEGQGTWFTLGHQHFPDLATWKGLSSVKGAHRTGGIVKVDEALAAAQESSSKVLMTDRYLGAYNLFLASSAMVDGIGTFDLQAKQRKAAVTELRDRAKAARDYYAAGAPVIQAVLSRPTDVYRLVEASASPLLVVKCVFRNFVAYARVHWQYSALSNSSGEDLLAGKTTSIPCGGIANALKMVLQGVLKDPEQVRFHTLSGYLLTKTKYACFDPLVHGNVRDRLGTYDGSCLFRDHYFLAWGGLYFDPCMTGVYVNESDVIEFRPQAVPKTTKLRALTKPGATKSDLLYVMDKKTAAQGFNSSWVTIPIKDATTVEALQVAAPPTVVDELKENPEEAKAIAGFCAGAGG